MIDIVLLIKSILSLPYAIKSKKSEFLNEEVTVYKFNGMLSSLNEKNKRRDFDKIIDLVYYLYYDDNSVLYLNALAKNGYVNIRCSFECDNVPFISFIDKTKE